MTQLAHDAIETVYRTQSRRVLATLIRLMGGFDAAEDALHEAFLAAAKAWPQTGIPDNPVAWLVSTGRFRVIDRWRREKRIAGAVADLAEDSVEPPTPEDIRDDELRLIFTCCHPSLSPDGRAALTLREVAGLTTEEIARAWLVPAATIAQRIVRAKAKIRDLELPYEIPGRAEWPQRLDSVLQVIYLIFNEGYSATDADSLIRADLCDDALRLGRLAAELVDDPEVLGLLALMLLHDARKAARTDSAGDFIALEDQDRSLWDQGRVAEAQSVIARALTHQRAGPYLLQAAIADLHTRASRFEDTDWPQIVSLYDTLMHIAPSPVAALNRAVALGQRDGAQAGLDAVNAAMAGGGLDSYHLAFAARADFQRRLGQDDARQSYARALALTRHPAEIRLLEAKMASLKNADDRP
jgi:RNA polymerase sigma-70 factor (ECF subfamily)